MTSVNQSARFSEMTGSEMTGSEMTGSKMPTNPEVVDSDPADNSHGSSLNLHQATTTVDEVLNTFLFFRQFDTQYKEDIYRYLKADIKTLRWTAPDEETVIRTLSKPTDAETMLPDYKKLNQAERNRVLRSYAKTVLPKAKLIYRVISDIIKFFEQMHTLFPNMSVDDFERQVFSSDMDGLRDIIEALAEIPPVKPKADKKTKKNKPKSKAAKQKERMKPIVQNQRSKELLSLFVGLLETHGRAQGSQEAISFAERLKSQLKL